MNAEKVVPVKNRIMTNQMAHGLFLSNPYAATKLNKPIIARCGGKLAMNMYTRKTTPTIA